MSNITKDNILIPNHIAVIMDGNGRWAKKQGKERLDGHYEGVVSVRSTIESCLNYGVKYLTVYAFSTENWGRPSQEVEGLMELFCKTIALEIPSLVEQEVRVRFLGDMNALSSEVREAVDFCEGKTSEFDKLTLCVALNYGSRLEIEQAVKKIAAKVVAGEIEQGAINSDTISSELYTAGIPDPDFVIRTSGEQRISNFLLWQMAYSELYFTEVLWPDFREEEFKKSLEEYTSRNRRYGKI